MLKYILRRLATAPLVILLLLVITFAMVRAAPGNPFATDKQVAPETRERQNAYYHLNEPIYVQFGYYMSSIARGDLGPSLKYKDQTVNEIIGQGFMPSFVLGTTALVIAL